MSIPFEIHIFCRYERKVGKIETEDGIILHFKVTTDQQQRYYYIAVTEELKDQVYKTRHDLSQFISTGWETVLRVIPKLPDIYRATTPISKSELDKPMEEMRKEIEHFLQMFGAGYEGLKKFHDKYFPNAKKWE